MLFQRGRDNGENVVARSQRRAEHRRAGGERRHAGHHLDRKTLGDAAEEVHEGAVEKGIALAERRDVAARREMAADLHRRAIVDLLRGKALGRSEEHTSELQSLMRISY